ncbi:MAG: hypothetical protein ACXACB_09600 [Promethearchaeota archaeon]
MKTSSNSKSFTYTTIPKYPKNNLIIIATNPYVADANPNANKKIPKIK